MKRLITAALAAVALCALLPAGTAHADVDIKVKQNGDTCADVQLGTDVYLRRFDHDTPNQNSDDTFDADGGYPNSVFWHATAFRWVPSPNGPVYQLVNVNDEITELKIVWQKLDLQGPNNYVTVDSRTITNPSGDRDGAQGFATNVDWNKQPRVRIVADMDSTSYDCVTRSGWLDAWEN